MAGLESSMFFLGIGLLVGSDVPGGIYFDNALVAESVEVIALAFILFAVGLGTTWLGVITPEAVIQETKTETLPEK